MGPRALHGFRRAWLPALILVAILGALARPVGATVPEPPAELAVSDEVGAVPERGPRGDAIPVILALLALMALAYVAGNPRVQRLEAILGISQVVTAGFPFVALGVIASLPSVGVLDGPVMRQLDPLLQLGLGWIGFLTGFRFDLRDLDRMPPGSALYTTVVTGGSLATVVVACGAVLVAFGHSWGDGALVRDAAVLGAAAAITVGPVVRRARTESDMSAIHAISLLDDIAAVVALLFLGAYLRPDDTGWALPGTAWLFVALGLGMTLGIVVYAIVRYRASPSELLVVLIGSVAFTAGMASHLHLSPIPICFVGGVMLANLPGAYHARLRELFAGLERPLYLLFLLIAGAVWDVADWRGWVLLPVFIGSRFAGRAVSAHYARAAGIQPPLAHPSEAVFAPMGSLSIAIVISMQVLYPDTTVSWLVTAVLGGAILTEVIVQLAGRVVAAGRRQGPVR
jgi:hypothetical protein